MQSNSSQENKPRITSCRGRRLHSAFKNCRLFNSPKTVALTVVICLQVMVPVAHGEVRADAFGCPSAIASARQGAAERPSQYLDGLQLAERHRVSLELEIAGSPVGDQRIRASAVESLWREGRHEDALVLLRSLEDQELIAGVGFDWQTPRPILQERSTKSSIDGTGGAGQVVLDHDPSSGNLFAVVRWGAAWGLFISHDQGASWSESYHFSGLFLNGMKVDLETHNSVTDGDFAYVAYSYNGNLTGTTAVTRIRRFAAANGAFDEAWGTITPLTDDTRNFKEIALSIGEWVDYVILRDDGRILDLAGSISNPGQPWLNQDTDVTNADRGLDVAYPGPDSENISLFITYVGDDDRVSMARRARPTGFLPYIKVESSPQPWADKTSIVAAGDIATVAWEYQPDAGSSQGVRTMKVVAFSTFGNGILISEGPGLVVPGVDLHDPQLAGSGEAIVYTNGPAIMYRDRPAYYSPYWSNETNLNDQIIVPGEGHAFAFEWLEWGYGVAYFDANGDVYFNASTMMFEDGFESGDLSGWSSNSQ